MWYQHNTVSDQILPQNYTISTSVLSCQMCGVWSSGMELSLVAPLELHHTVTVCQERAAGMIADVVYLESYTGLKLPLLKNRMKVPFYSSQLMWDRFKNTFKKKKKKFVLCCDLFKLLCLLPQMLIMYSIMLFLELLLFISWKSLILRTAYFFSPTRRIILWIMPRFTSKWSSSGAANEKKRCAKCWSITLLYCA